MIKCKKGAINIFLTLGILLTIIAFAIILLAIVQINVITQSIKQDVFYISNNAIMGMDEEELSYSNYVFNEIVAKEKIETLLQNNHVKNNGSIKEIEIISIKLDKTGKRPMLYIMFDVKFVSIVKILNSSVHTFTIEEKIPLSLMYYKEE